MIFENMIQSFQKSCKKNMKHEDIKITNPNPIPKHNIMLELEFGLGLQKLFYVFIFFII